MPELRPSQGLINAIHETSQAFQNFGNVLGVGNSGDRWRDNIIRERQQGNEGLKASEQHQIMSKKICELTGQNKKLREYLLSIVNARNEENKKFAIESAKKFLEGFYKEKKSNSRFEMISKI